MKGILDIQNITMKFGELTANRDVNFSLGEKEIVSLIGPNGAGKTTLFNCVSGFYKPFSGSVLYRDSTGRELDITGLSSDRICALGITRTFQIAKTLNEMTVEENVMTGAFLRAPRARDAKREAARVMEMTGLSAIKDESEGSLTIIDRKKVDIARALATGPRILMLDECMAGLNQTEVKDVMKLAVDLKSAGLTLLIVEHIMEAIMPISDRIVVLDAGEKIAEGEPRSIAENEDVIRAYLGEKYHARAKKY